MVAAHCIAIIMYSSYITMQVSTRERGSMGSTVHYTVLSRSYKFLTHALTLSMSFCCFKVYQFYGYKTESTQCGA